MRGLAIGGTMSSAAVSLHLADEEATFLDKLGDRAATGFPTDLLRRTWLAWKRYVDDILMVSRSVCGECLLQAARMCYAEALSVTYQSKGDDCGGSLVWVDLELHFVGWELSLALKSANRQWLHTFQVSSSTARPHTNLVPWAGCSPAPLHTYRTFVLGRLARAMEIGMGPLGQAVIVLEVVLELFVLQFPLGFLRRLVHSLPCSRGAQLVRRAFREWPSTARAMNYDSGHRGGRSNGGQKPKGYHQKKGQQGQGRQGEHDRDRDRRRSPDHRRRRDRSASSLSESEEERHREKVEKARKLLLAEDPKYREYHEQAERELKDADARRAAQILSEVLDNKFKMQLKTEAPASTSAAPAEQVPAAPAAALPGGDRAGLTNTQKMLLEVGLGQKVDMSQVSTADDYSRAVVAKWSTREVSSDITTMWKKFAADGEDMPRGKEARAKGLFELARAMAD